LNNPDEPSELVSADNQGASIQHLSFHPHQILLAMKTLRLTDRAHAAWALARALGCGLLVFPMLSLLGETTVPLGESAQIQMVQMQRDAAAGLTCEGKYQLAEQQLYSLLANSQQLLGWDHPQTLLCQQALGILYLKELRFDDAEMRFRIVLRSQSSAPEMRESGRICFLLALALAHQHKLAEAKAYSQIAFREAEAALGPDYPTTLLYKGFWRQLREDTHDTLSEPSPYMTSNP
jgi:hypothetical protein